MVMIDRNNFSLKVGFFLSASSLSIFWIGLAFQFVIGTAIWSAELNEWNVTFPTWFLLFIILGFLIYYALFYFSRLTGQIFSILMEIGFGVLWTIYYLTPEKTWCIDFPAYNQALGIIGLTIGIISIVWTFGLMIHKKNQPRILSKRQHIIIWVIISLLGVCSTGYATNWFNPMYTITVPAQNGAIPLHFTFWTQLNLSLFNSTQLDELNRYNATLITYEGNYSQTQTFLFTQQFRDMYPNIRIMFPIWGSYYSWNTYESQVSTYLTAITNYNLTNVIGFSFDIERQNDTCAHDAGLLKNAITALNQSIQLIKTAHPNYYIYNTDGIWMMFGDFPLASNTELYFQHPLMSVQGWDYYSWQLYRGNAGDPAS